MTRDRFIKLLMARGEEIRQAREIAFRYNARKIPYEKAYSDYFSRQRVRMSICRLGEAAAKLGANFRVLSIEFEKFNRNLQQSQTK